jgi:hypothetical protein
MMALLSASLQPIHSVGSGEHVKAGQELLVGSSSSRHAPGEQKVYGRTFWLIVAFSLVIRVIGLWLIAGSPLASDSTDYREMASLLLGGGHFVPYWPPGLSLYLAPFLAAGLGDEVLRFSMLGWWLLFCFGLARLGNDLRIKKEAWLLLLAIFSITPALIHFSIEPMTQMPAAALLLWAVSAAVRCSRDAGWGEFILLGGTLGALSLVRPSVIPMLVALPVLVYLRRRSLLQPLAAMALGAVMLFVWMMKVHELSGQWTLNNSNGVNLYYGNNPWTPDYRTWYFGSHAKLGTEEIRQFPEFEEISERIGRLPETERGAEYKRLAVDYVLHHPGVFVLRTLNRVRCFWGFDIFTAANLRGSQSPARRWFPVVFAMDAAGYLVITGFAFFWIAAASTDLWRRWETWLLAGTVVLYALPYWVTMSHPTYHFPVVAPLVLLGVMARELVRSTGVSTKWRGWAAVIVLALIQVEWMFYLTKS